jgi:hypothetical protein
MRAQFNCGRCRSALNLRSWPPRTQRAHARIPLDEVPLVSDPLARASFSAGTLFSSQRAPPDQAGPTGTKNAGLESTGESPATWVLRLRYV